jgi:hypothetical protein
MMYQANPVSQVSSNPIIGVKMQKLQAGDHFPIANTDDNLGMISKYTKIPTDGNYIVVVRGGVLGFVKANPGPLQLFNNDLGWTSTQDCEE